ncbi:transcription factor/nuclear export subunit protein 2-domain-containing protein [Cokeromyces recurvatus]|uniref:transcription factor/nuclear export subunit protein 2-domain-containing protein n=1 Tax=Cokeromyces recurvatus TaxID=90255 RepID=UPI00221FCBC1|nr:transcription factor/nuclear export subunit protein 2-domain-containing protein [Cokeromyces recurvatus]KAI7906687.1 transcription factor/nuclear export subunit protein 2-domain-containing protein [Cokeromyces recurvatus]
MSKEETSNATFTSDIPFEKELEDQKNNAPFYKHGGSSAFRKSIQLACKETYFGRRSIPNFVKLASFIITDKDAYFKQNNIDAKALYFNTLKTYDCLWEILREKSINNPDRADIAEDYKQKTRCLTGLIKGLLESKAIDANDCKVHLSVQLLVDCGVISNKAAFERRLIRLNTAMLYKQDKFNLAREAGEGYSNLLNELTNASIHNECDTNGSSTIDPMIKIPYLLNSITSLMGVFHLDPNRVLDIILDFFIRQVMTNYIFWIELIKKSDWIQSMKFVELNLEETINPSAIMAQLFGFRFHNYHNILYEKVPQEIFYAIAILLKHNLIKLSDILSYLYPYNEDMESLKNDYISKMNKEITTNTGGKLAMYGALGEDGNTELMKRPTPNTDANETYTKDTPIKKYEGNDVVELTKALLSIGDLKNAQLMLSEYDKLIDLFPELAHDIYRLCKAVLEPAYTIFVPPKTQALYTHLHECAEASKIKSAFSTQDDPNPTVPDHIEFKSVLVTDALLHNTRDLIKKERYVFFYKEWEDNLQPCLTVECLTTHFLPLMRLAGHRTYLVTDLIHKLILIIGGIIERGSEIPDSRVHCNNMLREILLPAISFSHGNPGTMASVWEVLCHFSFQERYALYGEWFTDFYKKTIETKLLKARTERAIKGVMRRISKNDVRRCSRDLGKLAHSNPTLVFNIMLDQLQQFDNMAPMLADACRYLGDFSYDVLGYVLTDKWTGSQGPGRIPKTKEKEDGMPATWLRALSVFAGMLFKKQDIEATPLLRYIARRLRYDNAVSDLIILNEFITKMGGIEILASACTEDQITAASCSEFLKTEAFLPISMDNRRASRRVLNRLKDSLRRNNIGFEILVLLYRLEEVYEIEQDIQPSTRCSKIDRVRQTQLQYFELLMSLFEGEEFASFMPDVDILVRDYALPLEVALNFNRPKTQFIIQKNLETPVVKDEIWPPFKPLNDVIPSLLPSPPLSTYFSSEFYTIFWQLSLYDIYCPESHYEAAIKRHTEMVRQCQDTRSSFYQSNRPSVVSKAERQAQASLEVLREDLPRHKAHVAKVISVLNEAKSRWFPATKQRDAQTASIMDYCILHRSRQSEIDAAFCFEFSMLMHRLNVPNFSSLTLFDRILSEYLSPCFIALSEYEATNYSRFFYKSLMKMKGWCDDEKLYNKEAIGDNLVGFQKNWNDDSSVPIKKEDLLAFSEFQRFLHKWHFKTTVVIEHALKSDDAYVIKNSFLVLRQFIPCFPLVQEHGNILVKVVKRLAEEEKRGNIKVLARSYLGLITKYKSKWIPKQTFLGIKNDPAPVDIKIALTSSSSSSSNNNHSSESNSSSKDDTGKKRADESSAKHTSSRSSSSQNQVQSATSSSSSTQKRQREDSSRSESSRPDKSARVDESSRHHHRTTPSSTRRSSPRETKADPPRSSRDSGRDTTRENGRETVRESGRETVRESGREGGRDSARDSARESGRESGRETRNAPSSPRRSGPSPTTANVSRSSDSRGAKREAEDRGRHDRPEKRRDVRDDRSRGERRPDERRREERRVDDRRHDRRRRR